MNFLIIDTATQRGIIALVSSSKQILAQQELAVGISSHALFPLLDSLFGIAGIDPKELGYIAVGHGPGSYTGMRVGVACAKGLSCALKCPLIGVSGLQAFVPERPYSGSFFSAVDARTGGVYLAHSCLQEDKIEFIAVPALGPFVRFVERLHEVPCIVTPSSKELEARLKQYDTQLPKLIESAPSVAVLQQLAEEQFRLKHYSLDGTLPLLYAK